MKTKTIYLFDAQGQFSNTTEIAENSQHNPAVATDIAPPKHDSAADDCIYNGKQWLLDVGVKAKRAKDATDKTAAENTAREAQAKAHKTEQAASAHPRQRQILQVEAMHVITDYQLSQAVGRKGTISEADYLSVASYWLKLNDWQQGETQPAKPDCLAGEGKRKAGARK
jgi:hypothetical protein